MCWHKYYVWDNINRTQTEENAVCYRRWNSIREFPVLRSSVLCCLLMTLCYLSSKDVGTRKHRDKGRCGCCRKYAQGDGVYRVAS